jgi:Flp pilus assembly protein TadG
MRRLIQCIGHRLFRTALLKRFVRQQSGASTVEFALVIAPFLALLFAILETAIVFFAGQALETAAGDSARLIMTGQAQTQGYDQAAFKNSVCARIHGLFNCQAGLFVDVRKYTSFSSADLSEPVQNGQLNKTTNFQAGGPGDIVVVRLLYEWPVYVSLLGLNLSDLSGGKRLIMATAAFRNEPY